MADRAKSLSPKAAPASTIHNAASDATMKKHYGDGSSYMDKFRNFVTGGADSTLKKAAKK